MRKIIEGKLYDTETARMVGEWANAGSWRDFNHMEEQLYRKRTGEFFLYGEGGPATKYAVSAGQNTWSGGSRIIPLSYENARQWAEEHLDAEEYAEIFGMPDESDEKVALNVMIPADLAAMLRTRAAEQGESLTSLVVGLLSAAVK